jgi:hypothetical protein
MTIEIHLKNPKKKKKIKCVMHPKVSQLFPEIRWLTFFDKKQNKAFKIMLKSI